MQMTRSRRARRIAPARLLKIAWVPLVLVFMIACQLDMYDQARENPYSSSSFFPNNASARPLEPGVVVRGDPRTDTATFEGQVDGEFVAENPLEVTDEVIERGRDRYEIYCATCHGVNADGRGIVAGYYLPPNRRPTSLYLERLRDAPDGYLFDVITNGVGIMYPYAAQLMPEDRWAVIAYIRQLQQNPPEGVELNPTEQPEQPAQE